MVSRTALCDQRRKLDKSCSSVVRRASPLVSPSRNTKKIQSVQWGKNVKKNNENEDEKKSNVCHGSAFDLDPIQYPSDAAGLRESSRGGACPCT